MIPKAFELTPEQVTEMGQMWGSIYLSKLSLEERLAGLSLEERLAGVSKEDILGRFKPEERFIGLKPEERLKGLSLTEMEVLEAYIQQVKRTHSATNPPSPPK